MKTSISITKCNCERKEAVNKLLNTDADYFHIDMMDGKFVDHEQLLPNEVIELVKDSTKPLDIHMMIQDPIPFIRELQDLNNINNITFHYEIGNTDYYIDCIHELGLKAGLAINPNTEVNNILHFLDNIDIILIMGVYPGEGGQKLIPETTNKINELIMLRDKYNLSFEIEFDGGVNGETRSLLDGLDTIVSGSYVCTSDNYQEKINELR